MNTSVIVAAAGEASGGEQVTFWICATLSVVGALGLILSRKTVHSALFTALTMLNLAPKSEERPGAYGKRSIMRHSI